MAEKYPSWSPYNYTLNNPVKYIDPDGKQPWPIAKLFNSARRIIVSGWLRNSNSAMHGGVDIAHLSNSGQISGGAVQATHGGKVTVSQSNNKTAGNWVVITNGDLRTRYLHMSDTPLVKLNETVKEGETIGYVGSTGRSEAPHTHYEVQRLVDGEWQKVNPVSGGQEQVTPSDQVDLIDPQKIIDERDGVNSRSRSFNEKLNSFSNWLDKLNSKLESFNKKLDQKLENNNSNVE